MMTREQYESLKALAFGYISAAYLAYAIHWIVKIVRLYKAEIQYVQNVGTLPGWIYLLNCALVLWVVLLLMATASAVYLVSDKLRSL